MRRVIAVLVMAVMMLTALTVTSYGATEGFRYKTSKAHKGYITRFYKGGACVGKVKTSKRLKVRVIKSSKLTKKALETRKNKCIVVEVIDGKCINGKGDGKTSNGYYINYGHVKGHKRGAKYTTYCVYGNSNYIDDVVIRADYRK